MHYLPPLILKRSQVDLIDARIRSIFDATIYIPLLRKLNESIAEFRNSISALLDAVRRGDVWYEGGAFRGRYSSAISKELRQLGATYSAPSESWTLDNVRIPPAILFALSESQSRYDQIRRSLVAVLDNVPPQQLSQQVALQDSYKDVLQQMEFDFAKTVTAHERIAIPAKFTPEMKAEIAKDWATNLDLYIKDWSEENILKLREQIESPIMRGGRAASLQKEIEANYGVSRSKAKFLAHQETSLLMSKFRETRYKSIGINRYKWRGAMDQRERPDHKALEGKVFEFSSPPVTNQKTGARNNPGEDYGCRCNAVPLVE